MPAKMMHHRARPERREPWSRTSTHRKNISRFSGCQTDRPTLRGRARWRTCIVKLITTHGCSLIMLETYPAGHPGDGHDLKNISRFGCQTDRAALRERGRWEALARILPQNRGRFARARRWRNYIVKLITAHGCSPVILVREVCPGCVRGQSCPRRGSPGCHWQPSVSPRYT
jgi:hypothetical protein